MDRGVVRTHLLGFAVVLGVAILFLLLLFPRFGGRIVERSFPIYFLSVSVVPVALWLLPPFVRVLTHATFKAHQGIAGRGGSYVRVPEERNRRFRDTVLMAIGPFSIGLFVVSEILYLTETGSVELRDLQRGLIGFPLLLLAGALVSLAPGAWLLDALEVRLVVPKRGEIVRAAEMFERIIGPVGAVALLGSFVILVHTSGDSYEAGLILLGLWALRLFPPVLGAVCVYRLVVEPRILPSLEAWCGTEGIEARVSLPQVLSDFVGQAANGG